MIKNERQYRITKAQADRFADALRRAEAEHAGRPEEHPLLRRARLEALKSQLDDLHNEIAEYEGLSSGACKIVEVDSFDELPAALIRARIAAGLSQKELAERLGMKEQQIQRYEATDYAGASFSRLSEIVKALGVSVREDIFIPTKQSTLKDLVDRLQRVGLDWKFVASRLVSRQTVQELPTGDKETSSVVAQLATVFRRVFGCSISEILASSEPTLDYAVAAAARFKIPARADLVRLNAYTIYAHYIARLALQSTADLVPKTIPRDPADVIRAIRDEFGKVDLSSAIEYAWRLGVVVLPLDDPGAFHGACWRINGRNILLLKQRTKSEARWSFDLFHELWHAGEEPTAQERTILELAETDQERRNSDEEKHASRFAGNIVLGGRAEKLVSMVIQDTDGDIRKFKTAVPQIAQRQGVSTESLANYLAFRLSLQGENWWGTANNLQTPADPWSLVRDAFLLRCNLSRLEPTDRKLLTQALERTSEVTNERSLS